MRTLKFSIILVCFGMFALGLSARRFGSVVSSQAGLTAVTGVTASDGLYNNKVGVRWDAVRDAVTYRILRSTSSDPASAASVGTTAAPYFFDATAVVGQQYLYWVRGENSSGAGPLGQPDAGLRASGSQTGSFPPLDVPPPAPFENPLTAAKSTLGKILFWDEQMSSTKTVSCGTCHRAGSGGSDPRTVFNAINSTNPGLDGQFNTADDVFGSPGVPLNTSSGLYEWSPTYGLRAQVTARKAPSYIDAVYSTVLFWDGRATSEFRDPLTNGVVIANGGGLESQAVRQPVDDAEMGHTGRNWNEAAAQIASVNPLGIAAGVSPALNMWIGGRSYPDLFQEAFGTPEVTPSRIAMAIASFERTLFSDQTPLDLASAGIAPLTAQEQRGRGIFGNINCSFCHSGEMLTDNQFRNIGIRPTNEDTGRFAITNDPQNLGEFRTPGLRNVALRGPYMHNGRFATLEEVVEFYNRGGDFPNAPNFPGTLIRPRNLTAQQKADLVAYMRRPMTDPRVAAGLPPFDRPTLYTESNRVPAIVGSGTAGSGGNVPQPVAIEPPVVGNPSFTVAVTGGLGGATAVLVVNSVDPGNTSTVPSSGSFARRVLQLNGNGSGSGYASASLEIPEDASLIGQTFFGRWYITDAGANGGVAVSPAFRFTVFGDAAPARLAKHADFDGDGKTDLSVFRPSEGKWYISQSSNGAFAGGNFGQTGDTVAPADFDGDGKADITIYRHGVWYISRSRDALQIIQFGLPGDKPQPGDYDGDGVADAAVWRPSDGTWYVLGSRDGFRAMAFGSAGDRPVSGDYDGDGKTDYAIYRSGTWYMQRSAAGFGVAQFGLADDKPVVGDYDGDGKSDVAVYRPSSGVWYIQRSTDGGLTAFQFGAGDDVPSPGDYDGDGRNDAGIFRPSDGNWYILQTTNGAARIQRWGTAGDISVPAAIVP